MNLRTRVAIVDAWTVLMWLQEKFGGSLDVSLFEEDKDGDTICLNAGDYVAYGPTLLAAVENLIESAGIFEVGEYNGGDNDHNVD